MGPATARLLHSQLNQAYFAFRGRYADSPASISPVGEQMRELRSYMSDIGEFVRVISKVNNPTEFEALLERMRTERGGDVPAPTSSQAPG